MAERTPGLIQIYTGNGKGKSTAAFGLALRAVGCGFRVTIIQFMKPDCGCGELDAFKLLPNVTVHSFGLHGFVRKGQAPSAQNLALAGEAMALVRQVIAEQTADILILDELNNAVYFDLVTEADALSLLAAKPAQMELVLTGRNATEAMIQAADLVTEMREIKHPYGRVGARKGIEY